MELFAYEPLLTTDGVRPVPGAVVGFYADTDTGFKAPLEVFTLEGKSLGFSPVADKNGYINNAGGYMLPVQYGKSKSGKLPAVPVFSVRSVIEDAKGAVTAAAGSEAAAVKAAAKADQIPALVTQAVSSDPTVISSAANMAQSTAGLVPKWKGSTSYIAGQQVVTPAGEIVSAKVNFMSGTTYNSNDWNPSVVAFPQRELVAGEDINAIRDPGVYTCPSTAIAATLVNWPAGAYTGSLIVAKGKVGNFTSQDVLALVASTSPPERYSRVTRASNNTTWTPWGFEGVARGTLPDGTNLDTFRESGAWVHSNPSLLGGLPSGVTSGVITVENFISAKLGTALSRLTTEDGRVFTRTAKVLAGWAGIAWKPAGANNPVAPTAPTPDAGLSNAVLISDFTQKMGGRKKVTTATVAFRFDHGLANFNAHVRPEMEAKQFKYSLALCSGQWERPENAGVTAQMVNGWVVAGLAEIWNHTKDHGSGDNSEAGWKAAILDGLTELQAQIPAASGKIFGFAPPGSTGTNFGGFTFGQTLDEFHNTDGGRFILSKHAVTAGYLYTKRVQDGMVRQGAGHITVDTYTRAQVQSHIEQAKTGKTALQIMLHPSRLNTEGYMTAAEFVSILDYVKAEETAGRLKVVSPYEQLLTDAV